MNSFFRYRSIDNFLYKYHELEKQEIFFATNKQENDPLEGWRPRFYKGNIGFWKMFWLTLFEYVIKGIFSIIGKTCNDKIVKTVAMTVWDDFSKNESIDIFLREIDCNGKYITQENLVNLIEYLRNYICYLVLLNMQIMEESCEEKINALLAVEEKLMHGRLNEHSKLYWEVFPQDLVVIFGKNLVSYQDINTNGILSANIFNEFTPVFADDEEKKRLIEFYYAFPRKFIEYFNSWKEPLIGIASFSKKYDDLYMWAVYGGRHRGVCLELEADNQNEIRMEDNLIVRFQEVKYKKELDEEQTAYNELSKIDENMTKERWGESLGDVIEQTHLVKYECWKHEEEYRILLKLNGDQDTQKRKYGLESLKSITFGMWASNRAIRESIKILKKIKSDKILHINIYKMYLDCGDLKRKLVITLN